MTDVIAKLERLNIGPRDVVVVRIPGDADDQITSGAQVKEHLRAHGFDNLVLVMAEGAAIHSLPQEAMMSHGWYRKATPRKKEGE